jgi:hypothetical protein
MSLDPPKETVDVPTQIFQKFLAELEANGVSAEVVARLRKTLLEEEKLTHNALRAAVIGDESPQP